MMRIAETQLRISAAGHFMTEDEGANPRHVTLKSEDLQIDHQFGVVGKVVWDSNRLLDLRQLPRRLLLRKLDSPLNASDSIGILIELEAIRFSDRPHQPFQILRNPVEYAAILREACGAFDGIRTVTVQPLENRTRPVLGWERRRWSTPDDGVVVHAA